MAGITPRVGDSSSQGGALTSRVLAGAPSPATQWMGPEPDWAGFALQGGSGSRSGRVAPSRLGTVIFDE
jgi:hypothetical protein